VVVRVHQAPRDDTQPVPARGSVEQVDEVEPVEVDEKDLRPVDAPSRDVEVPARQIPSSNRHGGDRTANSGVQQPFPGFCCTFVTEKSQSHGLNNALSVALSEAPRLAQSQTPSLALSQAPPLALRHALRMALSMALSFALSMALSLAGADGAVRPARTRRRRRPRPGDAGGPSRSRARRVSKAPKRKPARRTGPGRGR